MRRTFYDEDFLEWEAYVSGGQPRSEAAARLYFLCLTEPSRRARFVKEESGNTAEAERKLEQLDDGDLLELLKRSEPLS
ncbi:MAG: hypothetical protein ABEJ46_02965 [Gemmatimonadota bacterium]